MKIIQIDLNKDYSDAIMEAAKVLESGGVIIYPTDTVYGIGGNALEEKAIKKVFELKVRSFLKPLPIIIRNIKWAKELAVISEKNEIILNKIWPGKITAILSKKNIIPDVLTSGQRTVGMRVPEYPFLGELLKHFGYPLVSTSANISGQQATTDINKIIEIFSKRLIRQPDLILDAGILPKSEPSTILDLTTDKPKILRIGPSKPDEFLKLLNI